MKLDHIDPAGVIQAISEALAPLPDPFPSWLAPGRVVFTVFNVYERVACPVCGGAQTTKNHRCQSCHEGCVYRPKWVVASGQWRLGSVVLVLNEQGQAHITAKWADRQGEANLLDTFGTLEEAIHACSERNSMPWP